MRFNGLKSHLRLQKLRFLDAPGLFLLEIVLTGAYDLADVLANVLVLKWMIGALMGRDLIRAAWVLGGFLVYQLSVSFLWHWYFERVYPQWKERLEYKLNCRLYRIMLDADCRKYNEESYFHGYRRALQFTQTKMEETLEFYRQLFGSFLAGAVAVVIYIRMDQMIVVFVLLAFVASRFCVKSLVEKTNAKRDEQNKKDALHQNYLLCRLYEPTEGSILVNGKDISEYEYGEYLRMLSVVFQDFALFSMPLKENVSGSQHPDTDRVKLCLEKVGNTDSLVARMDAWLYKYASDDGIELSGGEAQKVAIARALYKDGAIMVLDEPTSAMDAKSEEKVFKHFKAITESKNVFFISHRLSACKICDRILVFDQQGIVQQGTHDALLENADGLYYKMWHAQTKNYMV